MTVLVVDTNVAIVANGRETHPDKSCRLACVRRLRSVWEHEMVAIDGHGLILEEYRRNLNPSGSPGVGDAFFKYVFDNQYRDKRVIRSEITPTEDSRRGFEELPENALDRSDRKFLAVAVVANAVILNATDSDWSENRALTERLGVRVEQLCPRFSQRNKESA